MAPTFSYALKVQQSFWCVPNKNQTLVDIIESRVLVLEELPPSQEALCAISEPSKKFISRGVAQLHRNKNKPGHSNKKQNTPTKQNHSNK